MATQIVLNYEGTDYTVEFNRKTADMAERQYEISYREIEQGKLLRIPELFYCGLKMHHPNIKMSTAEAIYDRIPNKMDGNPSFIEMLMVMYVETVTSLFAEPEEGKAVGWKVIK